ncbi:MAG: hypothetical protein IJO32_07725 [Bacilli bacterium]|nr:hypothetical protein [Bacilli bacterium]
MLSQTETKHNEQLSKLIEYGYDLHVKDMDWYGRYSIPNFEFYNGNSCPIKKVDGGGIFGMRGYPNHSESRVFTTLGVTVGIQKQDGFDLDYAMMIQTDNGYRHVFFSPLKISEDQKRWYPTLDYDDSNEWSSMTDEAKQQLFIKTMEFIGFKREDVLAVLNGTLTAREAYMNVAPEEIKNCQWVSKHRRMFIFDGNVAIEGNFSSVDMDHFPFPFEGQPILDCSKVKTSCIYFENNKRKVKLINVNENPESIIYTNLKNAIIDEPIDLSLVDAKGTKFGHHTVINLQCSKAKLDKIDLSLAVNEKGEKYVVNEKGTVQFDYDYNPKTIASTKPNNRNMLIFANADNEKMAKDAFQNTADGIGLVRTEHIFAEKTDVEKMVELLDYPNDEVEKENLKRIKELQIKQVKDIINANSNNPVVFRLLDFKLKEYLRNYGLTFDNYYDAEYVESLRGSAILINKKNILYNQVEAIFETLDGIDVDVNLLVPMVRTADEFGWIKKEILKLAEQYNLKSLKIGAMIENATISNDADELAKKADFISIGTNDLTESVTGLSRDTNSIEFQELTDEVKLVIEEAIYRARSIKPDITIGICGEHSNYILNVQYFSSLDIDYITCSPSFIRTNKDFLMNILNQDDIMVKKLKSNDKNN